METVKNKVIIYDDSCPLCSLYTAGFIMCGLLESTGRLSFSRLSDQKIISCLDRQRMGNEIPLVDVESGKVIYGVDALVFILKQKLPFIGLMIKVPGLYWFFRRLYKMISFNRRVIAPSGSSQRGIDCTPDYNIKYRLFFIVFAVLFSSLITWLFGISVAPYAGVTETSGGLQMLFIAGTGWLLQIITALLFMKSRTVDYLGHLSVVMIIGVLLLLPGILLSNITEHEFVLVPVVSIILSSGIMLWQHIKRVRVLYLSQGWTALWFFFLQSTALFWTYTFYLKSMI